jgi:hypothetical protein
MVAGTCRDWRLQRVLPSRIQVTRTRGKCLSQESDAAKVSILLTEKIYFCVFYRNANDIRFSY